MVRDRVDELLEFVQLTEKADAMVEDLSGGMKRRLTIARSLINRPEILLLDEPTTGLDPQARHVVWDRLFRLKQQGVTIVLTTHYMDEAEQLSDRLVVMDKGLIVAEGSPLSLIAEHSTREVAELRFGVAEEGNTHEALASQGRGPGRPGRGAARPAAALHRRRRGDGGQGARARARAGGDAGASLHARGCLPAAHRPDVGRLMSDLEHLDGRATAPTSTFAGAARMLDYWAIAYKRTWKGSVITSFVSPLLYVLAMGVLLGGYVDSDPSQLEGATSYLDFVAPGLLAAQAMTIVFGEVTYPVMGMVKWHKTYFGMTATPLGVPDVIVAHLGFALFRVAVSCAVFVVVMAPFGVFASVAGAVGAFLVSLLVGLAFATPIYALSAGLKDESPFALVFRLGMMPLFLFSGAFFPIANLDRWLQVLAKATPLWHGVDLTRMLTLGEMDWPLAAVHVVYLVVLATLGWFWAVRRLTKRMVS